jgi:hypothetical protein
MIRKTLTFLLLIPALILPGALIYWLIAPEPKDSRERAVRSGAVEMGLDPEAIGGLFRAEIHLQKGEIARAWELFDKARMHHDAKVRAEAYNIMVVAAQGPLRKNVLAAIEDMRVDPAPEVRNEYPYTAMLARKEDWRALCESLSMSPDAGLRASAQRALSVGKDLK